jgi:hypothetical protein
MPPLSNPRHEAFAQALFIGLGGKTRQERSQQHAYLEFQHRGRKNFGIKIANPG